MKTEWVEFLEKSVPDLLGFGRLVDYRNAYWHQMGESSSFDGAELTKLAGEAVQVAGMYKLNTERLKLQTRRSTFFVVTSGKSIICGLQPSSSEVDEQLVWESLSQALDLMQQFLEGTT